jgi:hypothetical protein
MRGGRDPVTKAERVKGRLENEERRSVAMTVEERLDKIEQMMTLLVERQTIHDRAVRRAGRQGRVHSHS